MNRKTSIPLDPSSIHLLCCKLWVVKTPRWTQQELRKMSNDDHTLTKSFRTGGFGAQDTSPLQSVGGNSNVAGDPLTSPRAAEFQSSHQIGFLASVLWSKQLLPKLVLMIGALSFQNDFPTYTFLKPMTKDKHIHIKAICHIPRMCWVVLLYKEQLPENQSSRNHWGPFQLDNHSETQEFQHG